MASWLEVTEFGSFCLLPHPHIFIIDCTYFFAATGIQSTEMAGAGDTSGKLKRSSDIVLHRQNENGEQFEQNRLSDIERLVKGNIFSRYTNLQL